MFETRREFRDAAEEARPAYLRAASEQDHEGVQQAFSPEGLEVAFDVYKAAQWAVETKKDAGLIVGNRLDMDHVVATEKIAGIDTAMIKNFETMSEATKESGRGEILDSGQWSILVNDAWLLGGIHYIAQFFLASPRSKENIYRTVRPDWFKSGRRFRPGFTVFSRELIGLVACGYKFDSHKTTGEIAWLPHKSNHPGTFTFSHYQAKVNEYTKGAKWHDLISSRQW
ncbi:hypothetical protein ACWDYJ_33120 [Streptomyces sp. NPDC003042]